MRFLAILEFVRVCPTGTAPSDLYTPNRTYNDPINYTKTNNKTGSNHTHSSTSGELVAMIAWLRLGWPLDELREHFLEV